MNYDTNPFQVLYVTDSPDPKLFVSLFSDIPIRFSHPMFQPGNVVIKGTQGCGKSMLLNLLKPQIRLAYHEASTDFPVPTALSRFVGAGINLTLSGALDIGQRPVIGASNGDESLFPLLFGDFLNYFVVRDLLRSVRVMADQSDVFENIVDGRNLDKFAVELARQDCWFDALSGCGGFTDLCETIDRRIANYRSFHQFNCELSESIANSKTNIGEPIARTEEVLKSSNVIEEETPVIVRIDQLEKLYRSDVLRHSLGVQYRRVVNKALSKRDSRVSYRIGTRPYAWDDDRKVYGTDDLLEHMRDYRIIDLDEMFRRKEDPKTWVFPDFADDAFRRRLVQAKLDIPPGTDPVKAIFGPGVRAPELARSYARNPRPEYVLQIDDDWPQVWKTYLTQIFERDPFEAKLAAAWVRQRGQSSGGRDRLLDSPPNDGELPWHKDTWMRDRIRQCLLQIAARCSQRQKWAGSDMIRALSAPNISVFLSVCHEIWDAFLRSEVRKPQAERIDPVVAGIPSDIQTVGIETASKHWYTKISELPGGHDRLRFVEVLGRHFRTWLLEDTSMTYPGRNGFSLKNEELERFPQLVKFLNDSTDYGDIVAADHTTKLDDRRRRTKWYLNPILSPFFQIPEQHKKEPFYASVSDIAVWLQEAEVILADFDAPVAKRQKRVVEGQLELFPTDSDDNEESS
jgi:hypothetical protein